MKIKTWNHKGTRTGSDSPEDAVAEYEGTLEAEDALSQRGLSGVGIV